MSVADLQDCIATLQRVSLFKDFKDRPSELEKVARILTNKKARRQEEVIREGEEGDTLYIMKCGAVNVLKSTLEDEQYTVVRLESTERVAFCFGELALLDNDRRSASIVADTECDFYVMKRDDFLQLGDKEPQLCLPITREISKVLAGRLRKTNQDMIVLFEALVGEVVEGTKM